MQMDIHLWNANVAQIETTTRDNYFIMQNTKRNYSIKQKLIRIMANNRTTL